MFDLFLLKRLFEKYSLSFRSIKQKVFFGSNKCSEEFCCDFRFPKIFVFFVLEF